MRLKRRVKVSAGHLERSMVRNGMEREVARKLAHRYEDTFSFRNMLGGAVPGLSWPGGRSWQHGCAANPLFSFKQ